MTDKLTECGQTKELMALRVSEDLNVDEAARVDRHARYCKSCQERLRSLSDAVGAMREAGASPTPVDGTPSLWDRIEPRLGPAGRQRRPALARVSTRQLAVACAALVALTVFLEAGVSGRRAPQPIAQRNQQSDAQQNQFAAQAPNVVIRPMLGVAVQKVEPDLSKRLGLKAEHGAVIAHVLTGSAADRSGLQTADVILAVEDVRVQSPRHLAALIGGRPIGSVLTMRIFRDGRQIERKVLLGAGQSRADDMKRSSVVPNVIEEFWQSRRPSHA